MDVLVLALFVRATLVLADMTNDGVNPEHGLQYGQTTVPSRVCKFFFCKVESFQETAYLHSLFSRLWEDRLYLLHFEAVALR